MPRSTTLSSPSPKVRTTTEIVRAWRDRLGNVPPVANHYVCKFCLGPVSGFNQCYGCKRLFLDNPVPHALRHVTVPMTSASNPGPWYSVLLKYKEFERYGGAVLPSVAHMFLRRHRDHIAAMLGGEYQVATLVPSKRRTYQDQPLRALMEKLFTALGMALQQTLQRVYGAACPRHEYHPEIFRPGPDAVRGKRVVLIEDTWITGATAISAAGRIMELGAAGVIVLPVARAVESKWWNDEHPYLTAMQAPLPADTLAVDWPR